MNIVKKNFGQNFNKIYSKTHQIALFFKIFSAEHAPDHPSKCVALRCAAWRECKYLHFIKSI